MNRSTPEHAEIKAFGNTDKEEEEYFSTGGDAFEEKENEDDSKLEEKLKFMDNLKPISSSEKEEEADIFASVGKYDISKTSEKKESIVISIQKDLDQTNGSKTKKRLNIELEPSAGGDESPPKKQKTEELNHVSQNQPQMKTV